MTSLSFFAFRQPQKGGFARAVKDKGVCPLVVLFLRAENIAA